MAIKTLRVFQEFTSAGYIPMPVAGNIDYGVTIAGTFPGTTPTTFQTDDPDIDVTLTATTDYYVWIRSHGTDWNPMYTRNVRVYPDSPLINNVVMGIIIANLSSTVPYTGATANVNLGEYGLTAGYLGLDLTPTGTPTTVGTMSWNDADGTMDLKLKGGNVTLQVGQEQVTRIVNKTGANLLEANYQAVRISGAQGNRLKVDLAQANIDANSTETLGLVTETINNNQEGFITTSGLVRAIDTTGTLQGEIWNDGDILYLSGSVAGQITNIKPQAPTHTVIMGYVVRAHQTQGQIYVKVDNGYELDELHNVKITSVANKNTLVYDTATLVWKNRNIFGTQGYIPYYDDTLLMKDSIIYTNGTNVGIGSTTLTEKLVVNGNILAAQFKKVGGLSTEFLKADGSSDATAYQPLSADLTAIDNLALTTGLLRKNGTDTWELDQTEYLSVPNAISTYQRIDNLQANLTASATKYPSVNAVNSGLALKLNLTGGTLTGGLTLNYSYPNIALSDVSSGTTWNITNDGGAFKLNYGATNKFYIFSNGNAEFINNLTASALIKAGGTSTQFLKADGSVDSTAYQPYDADLSAIAALALTTGLLRKNGANTWELDQTEYVALSTLIANYQTIANLSSNLTASATKYPSVNAVNTGLNLKLNLSGGTMSGDLALSYSIPTIQLSDTSSGTIWNIQNDGGGFEINSGITNKFVMLSSGNATFVNDLTANKFIKSGGTSAQFLMADGSVSSGVSGGITGTLTTNYIPKSSGTNTITDSVIQEVSGIIGIGSTPSGWDYSGTIQLPSGGIFATRGSVNMVIAGALYNSGWKYNSPGLASMFEQDSGGFKWYTAISGSGGAALTWLQKMNLNPSGRLLINQTTDDGVNLIQANGSIISTGFKKSGGTSSQFLKADGSVDSSAYITRTSISATSPISYDNSLGVISIQQASGTTNGFLSNTDWTTFNGKQSLLSGTGIVKSTAGVISYLTDNSTNWDTAYNRSLVSIGVSGTTTKTLTLTKQDGTTLTASWTDINTDAVTSVFGRTGAIVATSGDYTTAQVTESGNLYYTDARARGAISLTTSGTSGAATYNSTTGVLNIPQYQTVLTNPITGTGTTNYVPKFTGSGAIGNGLIYDDATSIGINNTSPQSFASGGVKTIDGKGSSGFGFIAQGSLTQIRLLADDSLGGLINVIGAYPLAFFTNGSERMRITSAGNVGIGTTSPSEILHVKNSGATGSTWYSVYLGQNSTGLANGLRIRIKDTIADLGAEQLGYNYAGTNLTFSTEAQNSSTLVERARIDYNGNFGLGVTPSAWSLVTALQVVNASIYGYGSETGFQQNAYYNAGWKYVSNATAAQFQIDNNNFNWKIATSGTAGTAITWTQAMTLDASGNLGLGTSSPSGYGSGYPTIDLRGSTGSGIKIGNATDVALLYTNSTATYLRTSSYKPLIFGTFDTERVRISEAGNVGIGTTSPSAKLTVQGLTSDQIRVYEVTDSANYYKIGRNSSTGYLDFYGNQSGYIGYLFGGVDGTRMILNSSGNLGLGVTPSAWSGFTTLELQGGFIGGGSTSYFEVGQNNYYDGAFKYKTTGAASLYEQISGSHRWYNAPSGIAGGTISFTQAMTLDASGNLLVGTTTNPYNLSRLTISHNSTYTRTYFQRGVDLIEIAPSDGSGANIISSSYTSGGSGYKPLGISARQNTADLYLNTSGNISIGTTTDSGYKLDVNGSVRFSGAIISSGSLTTLGDIFITGASKGIVFNSSVNYNTQMYESAGSLYFRTGGIDRLNLASTGAATFSSSVQATTFSSVNSTPQMDFVFNANTAYKHSIVASNFSSSPVSSNILDFRVANGANSQVTVMNLTGAGNVGIGTSSPSGKLDILGANNVMNISGTNAISAYLGWYYNTSTLVGYIGNGSSILTGALSSDFIFRSEGNLVYAAGGNTERMRITSGGQILMGTTTAQSGSRLQVAGGFLDVWSSANTLLRLRHDGTRGIIETFTGGAYGATSIAPDGGNVGIGTSSPVSKLTITNGNVEIQSDGATSMVNYLKIGTHTNGSWGSYIGASSYYNNILSTDLRFGVSNSGTSLEALRITSGGNVLIAGSATQGSPILQIDKSDANTNSSSYFWNTYSSGMMIRNSSNTANTLAPIYFYMGSGNNSIAGIAGIQESSTLGAIGFFTGGSGVSATVPERMRITSDGSVGINNTNPVNTAWGSGSTTKHLSIDASNYAVINLQGGSRKYSMGAGGDNFYMCYDNTAARHNLIINSAGAATFSSSVSATSFTDGYITISGAQINRPATVELQFSAAGSVRIFGNTAYPITFTAGSGAASFSSSVSANGFNFNTGARSFKSYTYGTDLTVNTTGGWAQAHRIYNEVNTTQTWFFGAIGTTAYIKFGNPASIDVTGYNGVGFELTSSGGGTFASSLTATSFFESSDKTIKTLLVDNYQTKGIESITAKLYTKHGKEELGYFAQDVQGILPSAVTKGTNGLLNLSYREVLVAKVQRTETEIEKLKNRVLELETQLNLR